MYLKSFGREAILTDDQITKAQQYLIKVYKKNAIEKDFDELRSSVFKQNNSVFDLPPTSHSIVIKGHIPRWFLIVKQLSSLLLLDSRPQSLDPLDFGWKLVDDELLPEKHLNLIPDKLTYTCACKRFPIASRCSTKRCKCKKFNSFCTEYCKCQECSNNL